jgi:hypothetical protein
VALGLAAVGAKIVLPRRIGVEDGKASGRPLRRRSALRLYAPQGFVPLARFLNALVAADDIVVRQGCEATSVSAA